MTNELRKKLQEIADIVYGDDKIAVECAMEEAEEDGWLFVCFDDYSEFEPRFPTIEEACWARGLTIEPEGGGYAVREDREVNKKA